VCGEYISNEVIPFLSWLDIDLDELHVARINRLQVTSVSGVVVSKQLDLGGFGLSRYTFDNHLYKKASAEGVTFLLNTRVDDFFTVTMSGEVLTAPLVIGAFGKRSNLDQKLKRSFFLKRSPYLAVKFHIRADFPDDLIQLNNYSGGYCGVSKVDGDRYCMCYLAHRDDLRKYGTLAGLEKNVICKNAHLKKLFDTAEFLLDKPEVINEISFEKKQPVEQHILMSGDTTGMIAPLCGNGMTMAIHSAKMLSENIVRYYQSPTFSMQQRELIEKAYTAEWEAHFARRLWVGRQLQRMFGQNTATTLSLQLLNALPKVADYLISKTHGQPFS
jgi:flavin-dependent dehydrogenase